MTRTRLRPYLGRICVVLFLVLLQWSMTDKLLHCVGDSPRVGLSVGVAGFVMVPMAICYYAFAGQAPVQQRGLSVHGAPGNDPARGVRDD